jgi:cytochrome c oxidase subunit II
MNFSNILATGAGRTFFLPQQASNLAIDVDWAWNAVLWTTTVFFLIVVGAMTYFIMKYRRRSASADATSTVTHNTPLEVVWTVIPLIIVIAFFFVGFKGFMNLDNPRSDAVVIDVEARKWNFQFTYPNGAVSDTLYVEMGKPVRLNLHSVDVLHALYIPAFRVQRNLIPYRQTALWFIPTQLSPTGNKSEVAGFPVFCTQYCGDGHSKMYTRVHVLRKAEFDIKMTELANPFKEKIDGKDTYVQYKDLGKKLYAQMGCATCHTLDGKNSTGPTWKDLWKRDHQFSTAPANFNTLSAGDPDDKWEEYLHDSMTNPGLHVVANFQNQMPSFAAQLGGSEANIEKGRAIVEFIKSIGNQAYKPAHDRETERDLFDAERNKLHPESLAARKAAQGPNQ